MFADIDFFLKLQRTQLVTFLKQELRTPLHFAVNEVRIDIVSLLLDSGANVNAEDKVGGTVLFLVVLSLLPHTKYLLGSRVAQL